MGEPEPKAWHRFVEGLDPSINYPGIASMAYLRRIPRDEAAVFERRIRENMYPNFQIVSDYQRPYLCVILHSALSGGGGAVGYDACQSHTSREALEAASHQREPVISDMLQLIRESPNQQVDAEHQGEPGFVVVNPVGDRGEDGWGYSSGWIAATITSEALFIPLVERLGEQHLLIQDEHDGQLTTLFEAGEREMRAEALTASEVLLIGDRQWRIHLSQGFQPGPFPLVVLGGGLSLSLLFIVLVRNSYHLRSRAEALAERMTDAWRQSEESRRRTEEIALVMVTHVDPKGCWEKVTPRLCSLLGYPESRLIGHSFLDFLHPDDQKPFENTLNALVESADHSLRQEGRFLNAEGTVVWIEVNASPVRDETDQLICLLMFIQDVSDRKAWERQLHQRDRLLEAVARSLNRLIMPGDFDAAVNDSLGILARAADVDRAYIFTNHPHSVTGLPAHSMRYEWVAPGISHQINNAAMHDLPYNDLPEEWYESLENGRPVRAFPRYLEGPAREMLLSQDIQSLLLVPIMLQGGFQGFVGLDDCHRERQWPESEVATLMAAAASMGNAFHRQQTEEELEHNRELLTSITDNISEGIYRSTPEGKLEYVNNALAEMFGYSSPEEMMQVSAPIHYVSPLRRRELAKKVEERGYYRDEEVEFLRRDGSRFIALNNTVAVSDEVGGVQYLDGVISDITQRKEAERKINYLAHYDTLTGLPNRTLLRDRMEQVLAKARRDSTRAAVLFIDLDRFKNVNDSLGHAVGDRLLSEVSRRLQKATRANDTVSRQGGDEFIVLLPEIDESNEAAQVASKLLGALGEPYRVGNHELHVTPSIGISLFPSDAEDIDDLIRNADAAMYQAKEHGRFNFQFFTHDLSVQAWERLSLENQLRRAIQWKEFVLYYQPQLSLETGEIVGIEALIRWWHEGRLISPSVFIPVAEQTGMIVEIGDWVMGEACRQLSSWQAEGLADIPVSVNLSPLQFRRRDIRSHIQQALASSGLSPEYLMLELTESTVMDEVDESVRMLGQLSRLGVRLCIDDFGTGYSSLSYLKRFPIDKLKIDKSFVSDIPTDTDDMAITAAVIDMGHNLNLTVVAEGVETREQLEFLRERRCQEMQGFLFSRPVTAEEMAELLRRKASLDLVS
nr:EAL domain-containing protein [Natronospira proteinivora]